MNLQLSSLGARTATSLLGLSLLLTASLLGCSSDGDDGGSGGSGATTQLTYCDIAPIIESKCLQCHSEPPENGAPMSLSTYEELFAHRHSVETAVSSGIMPFMDASLNPEPEDLTDQEYDDLLEWLDAGAPEGEDCN